MRIALNLLYLIPRIVRGTETYAVSLIKAFKKADSVNHYYIFLNLESSRLNLPTSTNFHYVICPFYAKYRPIRYAWEQFVLPWQIRKNKIDIVHSLGYVGLLFPPCPSVVTIHDTNFYELKNIISPTRRFFLKFFVKHSARHSTHIITISNFSKNQIINYLNIKPNQITSIHSGPGKYIGKIKNIEWNYLASCYQIKKPFIVSFCSSSPHKNISRLISAFASLYSEFPHNLVLIGNSSPMNGLKRQIANLGLENRVNFIGYVPDGHVLPILASADLFVFPSWYEGFGLPILEAQKAGVPVVCSIAASLPEIAGNGAILFNPFSIEEMVKTIRSCLENNDLRKFLVKKGYENVARFLWEKTALETHEIYKSVYENVKKNRLA